MRIPIYEIATALRTASSATAGLLVVLVRALGAVALALALSLALALPLSAQDYNQLTDTGSYTAAGSQRQSGNKEASEETPRGLTVWTVDSRLGERIKAEPDTLHHMFMNTIFTTGLRGEYNTTGNLGAPRTNRIFIDQQAPAQFIFTQPYDFFITPPNQFLFTNTLCPLTTLDYNFCGDRTNGEDHLRAKYAVNAGKRLGLGFKFDYIYGRGYYQNQSTAHFNYTMYASYLGERYNAHLLFSTNHHKVAENGGVTDDEYVAHPEAFDDTYRSDEIPTVLEENWNRNDNLHLFLTHRYSFGFNRKVKMTPEEIEAKKFAIESQRQSEEAKRKAEGKRREGDYGRRDGEAIGERPNDQPKDYAGRPDDAQIMGDEPADTARTANDRLRIDHLPTDSVLTFAQAQASMAADSSMFYKNEYVPVTSLIHTLAIDRYSRLYTAYYTPTDYYLNTYDTYQTLGGDSIQDKTSHYAIRNTFGIALLEGFNKWAAAGIRGFMTSELRHFTLPALATTRLDSYNEHTLSVGGQLVKAEGQALHYALTAETWLLGEDAGQMTLDATADLNIRLLGDTITLAAKGYIHRLNPTFYYRHYHSRHLWWDNLNLNKEIRTHLEAQLSLKRTRTSLRAAIDNITDYTYFAQQYTITTSGNRTASTVAVKQCNDNISLLTLQLSQDLTLGPLNWESQITYQHSTNDALPVPTVNVYTNLYLHFKVNKVLTIDLGGDMRYFTSYKALDYCPTIGQFAVQDNGDQNVEVGNYPFVNVYANMHLKNTRFFLMLSHVNASSGNYFLTPHYPTNQRLIRFGLSWNFFN